MRHSSTLRAMPTTMCPLTGRQGETAGRTLALAPIHRLSMHSDGWASYGKRSQPTPRSLPWWLRSRCPVYELDGVQAGVAQLETGWRAPLWW